MAVGVLDPRKGIVWQDQGSTLTPEQIEQLQALEVRKRMGGIDTSPISHWTQGAARVVDALGGVLRERRLQGAASENQSYNSGLVNELLGQSSPASSPVASAAVPGEAQEMAATSPSPTVDISGDQQQFVSALLPAAIEEGKRTGVDPRIIVGQAALETGWGKSAPGNNYFGIKSHGQAGGNTMATTEVVNGQPVRIRDSFRAYESPADSVRGYGDFLLQNPRYEGLRNAQGLDGQLSALQASGYATDPNYGSKVGSIARGIQLPETPQAAIEAAAPVNAYADPTVSTQPSAPLLPAPTTIAAPPAVAAIQPQQVAQNAPQASPNAIAQALRVMADPRANQGTRAVAQALIQRQQRQEQAAQEQNTWVQRQQYEQAQQANDPLRNLQLQEAQIKLRQMQDPNANVPDAVRSLDIRAQRAGLQQGTPEYNNFFITQGVRPPSNVGAPPAGYKIDYDANNNPVSMSPISGSPAAMEAEARSRVLGNQQSGRNTSTDVITNAANLAREAVSAPGLPSTGTIGGVLSKLPETNAAELRRQVNVLTSNATVENLNAMRAASPTGGALGSVTEKEGAMLAAKSGALDPNSPNFTRDLEDYERTLLRVVHGQEKGDEVFQQTRQSADPDIQAAKNAIAKGANREAVIKRLQDAGLSTEGL